MNFKEFNDDLNGLFKDSSNDDNNISLNLRDYINTINKKHLIPIDSNAKTIIKRSKNA